MNNEQFIYAPANKAAYRKGYNNGLQRALDIVNGNWDAIKNDIIARNDIVEFVTRILTDLQAS